MGPNCRMIIEEILATFDQVVKSDSFIIGWLQKILAMFDQAVKMDNLIVA